MFYSDDSVVAVQYSFYFPSSTLRFWHMVDVVISCVLLVCFFTLYICIYFSMFSAKTAFVLAIDLAMGNVCLMLC